MLDVDVYHLISCFGETEIGEWERTTGPFGKMCGSNYLSECRSLTGRCVKDTKRRKSCVIVTKRAPILMGGQTNRCQTTANHNASAELKFILELKRIYK